MKIWLAVAMLVGIALGFVVAQHIVSTHEAARYSRAVAEMEASWQSEKAQLQSALAEAQAQARMNSAMPVPVQAVTGKMSPQEILARLEQLRVSPGTPAESLRQSLYWLEALRQAGKPALPAIREYVRRKGDLDLDTSWFKQGKGSRGQLPKEFLLPPCLRLGLFEVVRQIGGAEAEDILAETLRSTRRGVEVAYLAQALQEIAPNKYREDALAVAHNLLGEAASVSSSPLDLNHRDYLFAVLALYNDGSFVRTAQTQLVGVDAQVDRSALKYLQQALGPQAVPMVAQAYDDARLTNAAAKEPLARLALTYVGADAMANEFYQKAINDTMMPNGARKNLIEDLNQDGFPDPKNLTTSDLPLIQNRIALIEQLAPTSMDQVNDKAFKEAYKDLLNMRQRLVPAPQ